MLQVQVDDAFGHTEAVCVAARAFVPTLALLGVAEAGTGVEHDDAPRHIGPSRCMCERQVAAEGVTDEDRGTLEFGEYEVKVVQCSVASERRSVVRAR